MITAFFLIFLLKTLVAQDLYVRTFGNKTGKPVIFLHGGPGYNAAAFEISTAKPLSEKGYFVIVYDRRGEGRSAEATNAAYTFQQTFDDLTNLMAKYNIQRATLIGHSFGGLVGTLFAEKYPSRVQELILASVPVVMQETFRTILVSSKKVYEAKRDTSNLHYVKLIEKMDTASIEYSTYLFMHAMQNGFYSTKTPNETAISLYSAAKKDSLYPYLSQMSREATIGYWQKERYTTLNISEHIKNIRVRGIRIIGIYAKEDGLYSPTQVMQLKDLLGNQNVYYLDNCSHNVFIDRQDQFISLINGL